VRGEASRPILLLLIGRTLGSAASFLVPVVLARVFDQAEFGAYKQVFLVYFTLYGIAQVGMAESLFYFVPLAPREASRCVMNSVLVLSGAGAICLGSLSLFRAPVSGWMGNPAIAGDLPLIGGFLLLMLSSSVLEIVQTSRKRYLGASIAYAGSDLARAFLFAVPVLLFRSLEALLLGALAFGLIRCGAVLATLRREFGADLRWDAAVLRRQISYALPFGMAGLAGIVEANLHQYAVSHLYDAATFAVYSVGCLQIPLVDLVAGSACNVMMVRMAEDLRDGAGRSVETIWRDTTRKLALVFFPIVGFLLISTRELVVVLFTERYAASAAIFMIWSLTIGLAVFQVDGVLRVYADTRFLLALYAAKLALIASSIGWLLSRLGLPGAALATILAIVVAKGLALRRIRARLGAPLARLLPWAELLRTGVAAALAGAAVLAARPRLSPAAFPLLLESAVLYGLAYALLRPLLGLGGGRRRWIAGGAPPEAAGATLTTPGVERG
jgi:O-antigen/teichoic acid export membrane protein